MGSAREESEMSRYIDADALIEKKWQAESEACFYALEDVVSVTDIEDAPSIDIVRCKECKWAKANGTYQWCGRLDSTAQITADDFCSYGERKE